MDYGQVESNLRDMFRSLAADRQTGEVRELPGLTIASVGTEFQMFNTAFFNCPVEDRTDLERRVSLAASTFRGLGLPWSLWVCEELVAPELRRRLIRICERSKLFLGPEMPAMVAPQIFGPAPVAPELTVEPVNDSASLQEFCRIGAACFRVPPPWFEQIYDNASRLSGPMRAWVGYHDGKAVATAVTVASADAIGLYNLATAALFRQRGFGEAMSRHVVAETYAKTGVKPVVLQSTKQGLRLYERLGFQRVGKILVFPSH